MDRWIANQAVIGAHLGEHARLMLRGNSGFSRVPDFIVVDGRELAITATKLLLARDDPEAPATRAGQAP